MRNFPTSNFTSSQNGTEVSFTNSSANATSYLWNFGDGNTSTATNPVHVYAAIGDYDVTLSAINPCKTIDKTSSVMLVSGSVEATGLEQFSISPNPNQGEFKISISTQHPVDAMISLLDPTGKQIIAPVALAIPQGTKIFSFGKPNLAAGIYQVLVQTATGNAAFNVTVVK